MVRHSRTIQAKRFTGSVSPTCARSDDRGQNGRQHRQPRRRIGRITGACHVGRMTWSAPAGLPDTGDAAGAAAWWCPWPAPPPATPPLRLPRHRRLRTAAGGRGRCRRIRRHRGRLRCRHHVRIGSPIRHQVVARDVRRIGRKLLRRGVDLPGVVGLQPLDQRARGRASRSVGPKLVPEARRPQAALRLVEGVRAGLESLDLLDQPGDVAVEAVVLDRDRRLPEVIAVLDPLRDEGRLLGIVVKRRRRGIQGRKRRRIEQRLDARVTLGDVDDVAMDVVDRPPDELSEIGAQYQGAGRRVRVLDRCDLFGELVDDDVHVEIGQVVDLGGPPRSAAAERRSDPRRSD